MGMMQYYFHSRSFVYPCRVLFSFFTLHVCELSNVNNRYLGAYVWWPDDTIVINQGPTKETRKDKIINEDRDYSWNRKEGEALPVPIYRPGYHEHYQEHDREERSRDTTRGGGSSVTEGTR